MDAPFINRVAIRNYRSVAECDVSLGRLTFLVGRNGSGKSNFLKALRFVADSLRNSLDHALREGGTIKEVRRRSGGHPNHFAIRVHFTLPEGRSGHYAFRVGSTRGGGYEVQNEECRLTAANGNGPEQHFHVKSGVVVRSTVQPLPAALPDRLLLVAASGTPEFRPVFDALSAIEVYNLNPVEMANLQRPDPGELLLRTGRNAASILDRIGMADRRQLAGYLSRIVPGVTGVETVTMADHETIEFRQTVQGQKTPWRFPASSMSDGTLRALGTLLALFQRGAGERGERRPLLIGLEEPETALHPAAASILLAALREASRRLQIVVTSHSPDLLDNPDIESNALLAVENEDGTTRIGPIDPAGVEMLRQRLFTAGELLRQDQISTPPASARPAGRQLPLFDFEPGRR